MVAEPPARQRGLVLAGGGLKAAYAGGVLEQLLPALGHHAPDHPAFSHVQASSSGVFNAAMMASGKDGGDIGDAWRHFRPLRALSFNWSQLLQLIWGDSLLDWDRLMKNVVTSGRRTSWGLSLPMQRNEHCQYSFNAYNFTRHALVSFAPEELDEARFRACIALPRWFPPVRLPTAYDASRPVEESDWVAAHADEVLVDAVFATNSNAAALPMEQLDEIWVIWTVDVRGQWRNGWAANYFRMLEQSSAAAYARERAAIGHAGFVPARAAGAERPDKVLYEIAADVPLHYLFGLTRGGVQRAVRQGNADAKRYLQRYEPLWAER